MHFFFWKCQNPVQRKINFLCASSHHSLLVVHVVVLFQVVAQTIRSCLDELPGFPRTQIGFATFDSAIHFYNMKVWNIISITIVNISPTLP